LIWIAPLAIAGMVVFVLVGGEVVRLLWNWLLPPLFGWRQITFWQALALLALCRILFGGFGFRGSGPRSNMRRRMEARMAERWAGMTAEEREKYRDRYGRCGWAPPPPQDTAPSV
jgi:hypothetical protein